MVWRFAGADSCVLERYPALQLLLLAGVVNLLRGICKIFVQVDMGRVVVGERLRLDGMLIDFSWLWL